jgi:GTP cyclohydrolase II
VNVQTPDVARTVLRTLYGELDISCYRWGKHEDECVLLLSKTSADIMPMVRVQSACFTAEIFRSLDCDCHEQLHRSLQLISDRGGALVYLLRDGRGAGIFTKLLGMELGRSEGLDTADAYLKLGVSLDPRSYDKVAYVLRDAGLHRIRLLTNNPRKVDGLARNGIEVQRVELEIAATPFSEPYLRSKAAKLQHLLTQFGEG